MLTVDHLTCGRASIRLESVCFTIAEHSIALLHEPAGTGRSLLLAAIAGHARTEQGRITVAGHDITDWPVVRRSRYLAYAPARPRVWPTMTVADQLQLAWPMRRARRTTRDQVLDLFPTLSDQLRQPAEVLDERDARMLGLAVTLLRNKPLLLLDEPCHGLPPATGRALADYLHELKQRGTTIVAVDSTGTLGRPDFLLTAEDTAVTVHRPAAVRACR
ncbi:ATP-binding cassette domain-containing protein [Hamadaea sp. NPDC050747]|uniref:ATP-binding cassette domain-containing protein n=1 Tax=Hamadaea sp. NPDC050747 TaxID=3155789 RepID=UPI0033C79FD9